MAALTWILPLLCVAGSRPSSASPVPRTARVHQTGQDVLLTCNLTSGMDVTWYLLRSDQLLPLLTVIPSKAGQPIVSFHTENSRIKVVEVVQFNRSADLEILGVQEEDAGLYFCTSRSEGAVHVDRGVHLAVDGAYKESDTQPCWSLGICVLPASLVLCVVIIVTSFLCSGKPAVCCCDSARCDTGPRASEDASLHYSSLTHADKPRPSGRGGTGLAKEDVTYSAVASRKKPNGSHDLR